MSEAEVMYFRMGYQQGRVDALLSSHQPPAGKTLKEYKNDCLHAVLINIEECEEYGEVMTVDRVKQIIKEHYAV